MFVLTGIPSASFHLLWISARPIISQLSAIAIRIRIFCKELPPRNSE